MGAMKPTFVQQMLAAQEELNRQMLVIKQEIMAAIQNLPDNPRIHRLARNCFVMMSSDLDDNWTPQYHDFKVQYQRIAQEIDSSTQERLLKFFTEVITKGKIRETNGANFIFHPDVRKHLSEITGIPQTL